MPGPVEARAGQAVSGGVGVSAVRILPAHALLTHATGHSGSSRGRSSMAPAAGARQQQQQ